MNKLILKYPIILVHGIAARDSNLFWGRIPKKLRSVGLKVFPGNTDSWGSIENNAISLSKTVDYVLDLCQSNKVNIIAHSKGGLDSRFLISSLNYAEKIASLTTISTPHHGSEIVDYIFENKSVYNPISRKIINLIVKVYGDKSPEPHKVIAELTTKSMIGFNLKNLNSENVYYSSYHTFMRNAIDDLQYFLTYQYIKKLVGDNDGIVSVNSAKWGEDCNLIEGKNGDGISHSEIIDIKRKTISGVDIPDVYLDIVNKLSERGF
jgi:triacylglycerol lipase